MLKALTGEQFYQLTITKNKKEMFQKWPCERDQNLPKEEQAQTRLHGRDRYKNLP